MDMDQEERRARLLKFIAEYTKEKTATSKLARQTLIDEGIYNKKGQLRAEFGGGVKAQRVA
jgi:hypothetical protein